MKKYKGIILLILVLSLILSGCGGNDNKPQDQPGPGQQENNDPQNQDPVQPAEPAQPDKPDTPAQPAQPDYQSTLMDKIPYSVDMGLGFEYCDLTVNGKFRRVAVQYEMDSSVLSSDPCFTYYYVDIHGDDLYAEVVAVGRAFLPDWMAEEIRQTPEDELAGVNCELFEYDFRAASFKGNDKEYIVFRIPASWEPNTASMIIATDQGKLLADIVDDKSYQVRLNGEDPDKYVDYTGNTNFFSLSKDSITYLKVSQRVDGVTYLTEYSLTIDGDKITSAETGQTYTTTDTVPDLPDLTIY